MEKIELCHKEGCYSYSLKWFFKDRFKIDGDVIYIIPSQYILSTSRTFFQKLEKRVIMSVHQTHRAMGANL